MDWISFDEQRPNDGEKCLVCYKPWKAVIILTYNSYDECWDDDEGDDYFADFYFYFQKLYLHQQLNHL